MARIRTIKPEFFTSEQLANCSPNARLLFAGIWCFSDDQGVHPASTKRLKMEVFPSDPFTDDQIRAMVDELLAVSLLAEFSSDDKEYWHVTGWGKHQRIDRPTFRYPAPPPVKFGEHSTRTPRVFNEDSPTAPPRNGMESNGMESKNPKSGGGNFEKQGGGRKQPGDTGEFLAWLRANGPALNLDADHPPIQEAALACYLSAVAKINADGKGSVETLLKSKLRRLAAGQDAMTAEAYRDDAKRLLIGLRREQEKLITQPATPSAANPATSLAETFGVIGDA